MRALAEHPRMEGGGSGSRWQREPRPASVRGDHCDRCCSLPESQYDQRASSCMSTSTAHSQPVLSQPISCGRALLPAVVHTAQLLRVVLETEPQNTPGLTAETLPTPPLQMHVLIGPPQCSTQPSLVPPCNIVLAQVRSQTEGHCKTSRPPAQATAVPASDPCPSRWMCIAVSGVNTVSLPGNTHLCMWPAISRDSRPRPCPQIIFRPNGTMRSFMQGGIACSSIASMPPCSAPTRSDASSCAVIK